MNTSRTTKFSAHLSWTSMRRYLQGKLSAEESQRVEQHLLHCDQCSAGIADYIQSEEPACQKQYTKKLKGKLKSPSSVKKRLLSAFQVKALRTGTAVVALLVFSFFAVKTVVNKQATSYQLPSKSLAVTKQRSGETNYRPTKQKKTIKPAKTTTAPAQPKPEVVAKKKPLPTRKKAAKEKKVTAPAPTASPSPRPAAKTVKKKEPAEEVTTNAANRQEASLMAADKAESATKAPRREGAKSKPLPTLEKLDTQGNVPSAASLVESKPVTIPVAGSPVAGTPVAGTPVAGSPVTGSPVPGNQIRER